MHKYTQCLHFYSSTLLIVHIFDYFPFGSYLHLENDQQPIYWG